MKWTVLAATCGLENRRGLPRLLGEGRHTGRVVDGRAWHISVSKPAQGDTLTGGVEASPLNVKEGHELSSSPPLRKSSSSSSSSILALPQQSALLMKAQAFSKQLIAAVGGAAGAGGDASALVLLLSRRKRRAYRLLLLALLRWLWWLGAKKHGQLHRSSSQRARTTDLIPVFAVGAAAVVLDAILD